MTDKNLINIGVQNLIQNNFHFLKTDYYYASTVEFESSKFFENQMEVIYFNEIRRRKISIGFFTSLKEEKLKYSFDINITRTPYFNEHDFFSFNNYVKSLNKIMPNRIIGDFQKLKAEEILSDMAASLKESATEIISGNIWLEKFYPRKD